MCFKSSQSGQGREFLGNKSENLPHCVDCREECMPRELSKFGTTVQGSTRYSSKGMEGLSITLIFYTLVFFGEKACTAGARSSDVKKGCKKAPASCNYSILEL